MNPPFSPDSIFLLCSCMFLKVELKQVSRRDLIAMASLSVPSAKQQLWSTALLIVCMLVETFAEKQKGSFVHHVGHKP